MNKAILKGKVSFENPTIRTTQSGKRVASFKLQTSKKYNGEWQNEVHRIVCFIDGLNGVIEQYVKKDDEILIEGEIRTRSWEKDGVKKYTTEIVMDSLEFCGGIKKQINPQETAQGGFAPPVDDDLDSDCPF